MHTGTLRVETLVASVCVDTSVVSGPLPALPLLALSEQMMNPLWEHPLFCTSPRTAVGGPLRELLFPGVKSLLLRNKSQNRSHSCRLSSLWVPDPKSRLGRAYLPPRVCDGCREADPETFTDGSSLEEGGACIRIPHPRACASCIEPGARMI